MRIVREGQTMSNNFEIGQWVTLIEGIGQVIHVREHFVEKFTEEYFEGKKVGTYIHDVVVCKLLCDHHGKIRKKSRIVAVTNQWCEPIDKKSKRIIDVIKAKSPKEHRDYVTWDERQDIGGSVAIEFAVPSESIPLLQQQIGAINDALPNSFTLNEFLDVAAEKKLALDFSQARKFVPGTGQNFSVILFNRLYKTVGKNRMYTRVWCRSRESLVSS
jgi:hypothetical protein